MLRKEITFCTQPAVLICDGLCSKAWGINNRPQNLLSDDPDDYEFLTDDELGDAPWDPGTYEGGHPKPKTKRATSPQTLNKWCARECERSKLLRPGEPEVLPDFSTRMKNKPQPEKI